MAEGETFADRVRRREVEVGVIGLGYVGLPLAVGYAEAGFRTVGLDVDAERAAALMTGSSHIEDVSSERVAAAVGAGRLVATAEPAGLAGADAVFICVPTPFDRAKTPDLSYVRAATATLAGILRPGMLVVLQSTTFPGTTVEIVQPVLESTGLRAGIDFHLAFSPERVDPGNATWTVHNTPKVVGGVTAECTTRARSLLEAVMERPGLVTEVSSPAAAEMAKLLENTYRAVNIALVNELAILSHEMGIDLWEVIDAAGTKPFGFEPFYPGIGPGGHCIPVDPYYLSWRAREFDFQTKFVELAADTNLRMAFYVRDRIHDFANRLGRTLSGSRVLVLGATFKPGVSDVRNSRAVRIAELLAAAGAEIEIADPHVGSVDVGGQPHKVVELSAELLERSDLVVILVAHRSWPLDLLLSAGVPIFDAVNVTRGAGKDLVERL
ncbi:MAG: nucleotide sugar dehydrogenase [Acidimicrobiales bacterium]